jgi:uncharacterized membrane protein YgcG
MPHGASPSRRARLRAQLVANSRRSLLIALAVSLVTAGAAFAVSVGLQNPSFEDGLTNWTGKTIRDDGGIREIVYSEDAAGTAGCGSTTRVCVITGTDQFTIGTQTFTVTPNHGNKMVRLGGPFTSSGVGQDPNLKQEISQTFLVPDSGDKVLQLNFNVFTWDYTGFDDIEFLVKVTDENGATITDFNQGSFGSGVSLKSTGWQPAFVDLTGYEGQQVHLRISAGGTQDDLYAFWAYVDAGIVQTPPVGQPTINPPTNPATNQPVPVYGNSTPGGQTEYWIPIGQVGQFPSGCMPLPITVPINPGSGGGVVSNVKLLVDGSGGNSEFAMTQVGSTNTWSAEIDCVENGNLYVSYTLTEGTDSQNFLIPIGGLTLVDPAGVVYDQAQFDAAVAAGSSADDARTASAISGASVRLQRKPLDVFQNVLAGDPGISPNVNPQTTAVDGRYAWLTDAGTYRVLVTKAGFDPATSREVTVPPEVTDLHVGMTRPGTGGGGTGGGGATGGGDTGGGGSTGGGGATGGGSSGTVVVTKVVACAGLKDKARASCLLNQKVAQKCGKVKPAKKKQVCGKKIWALAKCSSMKAKTKAQKRKKATCVSTAKAIGKKKPKKG